MHLYCAEWIVNNFAITIYFYCSMLNVDNFVLENIIMF